MYSLISNRGWKFAVLLVSISSGPVNISAYWEYIKSDKRLMAAAGLCVGTLYLLERYKQGEYLKNRDGLPPEEHIRDLFTSQKFNEAERWLILFSPQNILKCFVDEDFLPPQQSALDQNTLFRIPEEVIKTYFTVSGINILFIFSRILLDLNLSPNKMGFSEKIAHTFGRVISRELIEKGISFTLSKYWPSSKDREDTGQGYFATIASSMILSAYSYYTVDSLSAMYVFAQSTILSRASRNYGVIVPLGACTLANIVSYMHRDIPSE